MNVRRLLGISIFFLAIVALIGATNFSGYGYAGGTQAEKDKKAKAEKDKADADKAKADKDKADADKAKADKVKADKDKADADKAKADKDKQTPKVDPPKLGAPVPFSSFDKGTFWQLQKTTTKQEMTVQGQNVVQTQSQEFLIEWTAVGKNKDGDYEVKQKIVGVKMEINIGGNKISYKSTEKQQKNPMTDFFEQLTKQELTFTIKGDLSEVKSIKGRDEFIKGLSDINPQMQNLLKHILSDKALTKMAEPTWYAFPTGGAFPEKEGGTWPRKSELDLGPIGKYETNFTFTYKGLKDDKDTVDIETKLTYTAPTDKAGLPFIIHSATLKSTDGKGKAIFDRKKGRFESSDLSMKLTGNLEIEVGSMKTNVELKQDQTASSTAYDALPAEWKAATK